MSVAETFWKSLLAQLPCVLEARVRNTCGGRVHLHHVAEGSGKRSPFSLVCLCEEHHQGKAGLHGMGPKAFIRLWRPPGDSEFGLLVWQIEDVARFLRGKVRL